MICTGNDYYINTNLLVKAQNFGENDVLVTYKGGGTHLIKTTSQIEKIALLWGLQQIIRERYVDRTQSDPLQP